MNAPPPFWAAWAGNRRKFPNPTALPATAKTAPSRVAQTCRALLGRLLFTSGMIEESFDVKWNHARRAGFSGRSRDVERVKRVVA